MPPVTILSRNEVPQAMRAIVLAAREGARDVRVRSLVAQAAREVEEQTGYAPEPRQLFMAAYSLALRGFTYIPDPYGEEWIVAPGELLESDGADCSSATALVLAIARACNLRGMAVLVSRMLPGGGSEAIHAFAAVEVAPGSWAPADLASYMGVGDLRSFAAGTTFVAFEVDEQGPAGVGFLDGFLSGIFGLFSAQEQRRGLEAQGEAAVQAAKTAALSQEQVARIQAQAVEGQADATRDVARIQALVRAREIVSSEGALSRVVATVKQLAPIAGTVLLAFALSPALANLSAPARPAIVRPAPAQRGPTMPSHRTPARARSQRPARASLRKGVRRGR